VGQSIRARACLLTLVCLALLAVWPAAAQDDGGPDFRPTRFAPRFTDPDTFDAAIDVAGRDRSAPRHLTGITVPHHLLAADLIARTFRSVDPTPVRKVIVFFPDHFKWTTKPFATTLKSFETVFGLVRTRQQDVIALLRNADLIEQSELFGGDHGIGAILPFIKHYLPDSEVVPIAVALNSRRDDWDRLAELLDPFIDPSTLIIQSTDFSHYLTPEDAKRHDQTTLSALAAHSLDAVAALNQPRNTDSRGSQYLQMKLQWDHFRARPEVLFNKNSQAYSDIPQTETTSYVVETYDPAPPPTVTAARPGASVYCFVGDTFFGRTAGQALADAAVARTVAARIASFLNGCRPIVNLEGVAVRDPPRPLGPAVLAMPMDLTVAMLRRLRVTAAGIANNHAMDLGRAARQGMISALSRAGITVLTPGSVQDLGPFRLVALTDIDNHLGMSSGVVTERDLTALASSPGRKPLIAFMHWGTEFDPTPGPRELSLAEALRKAGIALIVGAHPHVASQDIVQIDGGPMLMAFSLGNFYFDQNAFRASGGVLELTIFDQGTFFARSVPIPDFYDEAWRLAHAK
jgi:poly-gamma-glutamate synthesis protein (capsule biosynthesis protein)